MKTNEEIIIAALSDWGGKTKEQIANIILSNLQTLDKFNVELIVANILPLTPDNIRQKISSQICQLIPEEKEFKLLIKFNYGKGLNMSKVIWQRIQDLNLEDNQEISIYITNESKKELPKFKDIIGLFNK